MRSRAFSQAKRARAEGRAGGGVQIVDDDDCDTIDDSEEEDMSTSLLRWVGGSSAGRVPAAAPSMHVAQLAGFFQREVASCAALALVALPQLTHCMHCHNI
jgi:hypothetical protein